jgi:hypothetical protein
MKRGKNALRAAQNPSDSTRGSVTHAGYILLLLFAMLGII